MLAELAVLFFIIFVFIAVFIFGAQPNLYEPIMEHVIPAPIGKKREKKKVHFDDMVHERVITGNQITDNSIPLN